MPYHVFVRRGRDNRFWWIVNDALDFLRLNGPEIRQIGHIYLYEPLRKAPIFSKFFIKKDYEPLVKIPIIW